MEPRWLSAARQQLGQSEIHGRKHNPRILQWWTAIRAPFTDDETPWCAGFVGGMLESVGIKSSRSAAARSYLKWGMRITKPVVGCITVFERGPANGHVGFFVGKDARGNLRILGGNQGDAVNIKPFDPGRVLGYRWPTGEPMTFNTGDVDDSEEEVSKRESFMSQPDDPGIEEEGERPTFTQRVKNWIMGGSGVGFLSSLYDWRVAAVIVVALLIVFFALLYTKRI